MLPSPYFSPNTENQNTISLVLPIPTILPPASLPSLKVYSRRLQPPPEPANPVSISNSDTGTQNILGDSLPAPMMSPAPVEHSLDDLSIALRKIINDRKVGGKCYGFVTFTNPRSAMHAITEMDGRTVDGRVVKVNEVTTRGGRSGFGRESIRHSERGVKGGERGHWERGYDRDENKHVDGHRDRSQDRDHKRERGYDRPHDHGQSQDYQVNRFRVAKNERSLEDVEQDDERIRESSGERERDQPIKMQKTSSNHERRDKERSYLDDHGGRELSAGSSEDDQPMVERQVEISSRKLEKLKKEVSLIEELVNEKQNLVSKLHERSKKLEDSLTAAKNLTTPRQNQLSKLYKHYAQVGECGERLKISEQELQALVDSTMMEVEIG